MIKSIMCLIVGMLMVSSVSAQANDCEKQAKDYQWKHGGDLIFIQPLKENGARITGEYAGHWINLAWSKARGSYYYDPQADVYFSNKSEVKTVYEACCYDKIDILNYNRGEIPFSIVWHY